MNQKTKKKLFALSFMILLFNLLFAGLFVGLLFYSQSTIVDENSGYVNWLVIYGIVTCIVGIPLFIILIMKYRQFDMGQPSWIDKENYLGRSQNCCTICGRHPTSQKYHIQKEHNLKDVKTDEYYQDCGCDKCAKYSIGFRD